MSSFYEQLRDYLTPRFQLGDELGHGGMGTVYLAQDTVLHRAVAVKAISDQDSSAVAKARFLHEARRLAELQHRNIVAIFDVAPEGSPFHYFIMEYLAGETLEQRLESGPLSTQEVVKLGRELLAALATAHRRRVIHRDIKPGNIFLEHDRAVLTDFGIAKSITPDSSASTKTGDIIGTEKYLAPEQRIGLLVPQSDLYALASVLYESVTGDDWWKIRNRDYARWSAVPSMLREPLRRALAPDPADRFPDAGAFDRALWGRRSAFPLPPFIRAWSFRKRALAIAGASVVAAVLAILASRPGRPLVDVEVDRLRVAGEGPVGLGDSLARSLVEHLVGFPDFTVAGPAGRWRAKAVVSGTITMSKQTLTVRLDLPPRPPIMLSTTVSDWRALSDPLADSLLVRLYSGSPLDSQLPERVFPRSPAGMQAFLGAERAFARAWWDSAYIRYRLAATLDSTCVLCAWRHMEVGKFLSLPKDTADETVFRNGLSLFPEQYQALIRAELVPLPARLDSLDRLTEHWPKFLFGLFRRADEVIHRGPLIGRPRREASRYFERAGDVRPDFAPVWEHLLWLWVAEGNPQAAKSALDTLEFLVPPGGPTTASRDLLRGAFAWRFLPPDVAARLTESIIAPARSRHEPLDAGARYLNAFDAQAGAVWLGWRLDSLNEHRESAQLAQMFGYLGLGRPLQSRVVQLRLHEQFGDPEVDLFALELEAMFMMFDPDSNASTQWPSLVQRLQEFSPRAGAELRPRAAWMAALLAHHFGRGGVEAGRESPVPLATLLGASDAARRGDYAGALARTDVLAEIESAAVGDPFFRTALHLLRADWQQRLNQTWSADRELLWYENTDVLEFPSGSPQPAEVDWAFGVLARWRRAGLGKSDDQCRLYQDVARLWANGEPRYAARADSARRAATAQRCGEPGA